EERGGVEIGDGRTALEPHAGGDADGGEQPGDEREPERGAAEDVGPFQPGEKRGEQRQSVELHAEVEGLRGVEAGFDVRLFENGREVLFELSAVEVNDVVELLGLTGAPGVRETGVGHDVRIELII